MLNRELSSVNRRIQSIDRAAELLEAIARAPEPETAPELADACGLNRSTAWRILATLEHHGLVERDPDSNRYSLGFAVLRLAAAAGHAGLDLVLGIPRAPRPMHTSLETMDGKILRELLGEAAPHDAAEPVHGAVRMGPATEDNPPVPAEPAEAV